MSSLIRRIPKFLYAYAFHDRVYCIYLIISWTNNFPLGFLIVLDMRLKSIFKICKLAIMNIIWRTTLNRLDNGKLHDKRWKIARGGLTVSERRKRQTKIILDQEMFAERRYQIRRVVWQKKILPYPSSCNIPNSRVPFSFLSTLFQPLLYNCLCTLCANKIDVSNTDVGNHKKSQLKIAFHCNNKTYC